MTTNLDWSLYPNFTKQEFDCRHTGINNMQPKFMEMLQELRYAYSHPMPITSGYRHWTHPIEVAKGKTTGEHTTGNCCDIACVNGSERFQLVKLALELGFTRIGIAKRFLHLGIGGPNLPNNVIWEYQ